MTASVINAQIAADIEAYVTEKHPEVKGLNLSFSTTTGEAEMVYPDPISAFPSTISQILFKLQNEGHSVVVDGDSVIVIMRVVSSEDGKDLVREVEQNLNSLDFKDRRTLRALTIAGVDADTSEDDLTETINVLQERAKRSSGRRSGFTGVGLPSDLEELLMGKRRSSSIGGLGILGAILSDLADGDFEGCGRPDCMFCNPD